MHAATVCGSLGAATAETAIEVSTPTYRVPLMCRPYN